MIDLAALANRITEARAKHLGQILETPLMALPALDLGCEVYLKSEHLQHTGSFKVRGAFNKLSCLTDDELAGGISTVSAGNHAMAVAWAGRQRSVPTVVCMPETAPQMKVDGAKALDAEVRLFDVVATAFTEAQRLADEEGYTFLHPFDDWDVIAGQGTVGLEILKQLPELDAVIVGIGGGALCAGTCAYLKHHAPHVKLIAVEPLGANTMHLSFEKGEPVRIPRPESMADGLCSPYAGKYTYPVIRQCLDQLVLLTEDEIAAGLKALLLQGKQYVEPAGAAAYGALLAGKVSGLEGKKVVCIASGGNMDVSRVMDVCAR